MHGPDLGWYEESARAQARRTRCSGRAGATPGKTRRLSRGQAPAARRPLRARGQDAAPKPPDPPPATPDPKGLPSSRQGRPRQVLGGAAPARGANLGGERGGGRGTSAASQARSVPTPRPPPPPPPPPLFARQRAGLRGKESERETAPAAAWPVPAPRPPSPCRRERAGSAGPLGSGPIGRGGPRGPGPVPPPRATPPTSNRRRRRPAGHAPGHAPRRHARRPRPPARAPRRCLGRPARPAAVASGRHTQARRRRGNGTDRPLPECSRGREGSSGHVRPPSPTPRASSPAPGSPRVPAAPAGGAEGAQVGPRPALPPAPPRHSTKADAPSPTRLPLAPSLSVTSYIITRANQNGSDARCRGPSPSPGWMLAPKARGPRTRHPGARLRGGGRARAPPRLVPPRRRRCSCRSPSGSRERHKLRQLLQTHFMVSLQPGSRLLPRRGRGRGWKEPLWGGESSSGPSPRPHRARPRRASSPSPRDARPAAQPASPRQCQLGQLVTPGRPPPARRARPAPGASPLPRPPPPLGPAESGDATNFPGPRRAGKPPGSPRIALTLLSGGHDPGGPRGARASRRRPPGLLEQPPRSSRSALPGTARGGARAWRGRAAAATGGRREATRWPKARDRPPVVARPWQGEIRNF
uniref:basic proline-rich protein-like n=1 Tax=Odobenus rosmarus divergens TaxID=9708 RepID=UPI00063CEBE4|nr:PREDICTED: basic proline-rich protein-like [Odobenus rosmarus divergens]